MRIGILGATGPAGSSLGVRLASVGFEVVLGSRSVERAEAVRVTLLDQWPDHALALSAADNAGAATADVVVVATPWDAAAATARSLASELEGKVVISMANAVARVDGEFQALVPPRGSVAAGVQAAVPDSLVAAALHHVPARELGAITSPVECDVLVCSDHPAAIATTIEVASRIPGLRPLEAGGLATAAPVEAFTSVLLGLNVRNRTRVAVRLTGLRDG